MAFGSFTAMFSGGNSGGVQVEIISGTSAVQFHGDPDTVFVDVRGQGEIRMSGTVKGAIVAPLHEFANHARPEGGGSLPSVEANKRIILVCASGARSGVAAKQLVKMGYTQVANLRGGIGAWMQAGGPVER